MSKRIKYVGREGAPKEVEVRGLVFEKGGEAVLVKDKTLASNLAANPDFQEVDGQGNDVVEAKVVSSDEAGKLQKQIAELLKENAELRERNEFLESQGADYKANRSQVNIPGVLQEILSTEGWEKQSAAKRKEWANQLTEGDVQTAAEADDVIISALADYENDHTDS